MAAPGGGGKSFCVLEYHRSKSVVTVQRAFRTKYAKDRPTDKTICAWYIQFSKDGCCASRNQVVAGLMFNIPVQIEETTQYFFPVSCFLS
jgi:hypothetical protein